MLEKINLDKKMKAKEYDEIMAHLEIRLGVLQRACKEKGIPVMILMEGLEASGKGTMINRMIRALDPRGFCVFTMEKESEEEKMRAYMWRFMTKMPEKGRIHYRGVRDGRITAEQACAMEKQLTDDGMIIMKYFLLIDKDEQKKRLKNLEDVKQTKWRVTHKDWEENKNFKQVLQEYDDILHASDRANAPWTIVEAIDKRYATYKIVSELVKRMEQALEKKEKVEEPLPEENEQSLRNQILQGVDLSKELTPDEYREKKKELQKKLSILHNEMYLKRVPVILAFEGWDAGGKGGAIKRITQSIDPRGYEVVPVAAPNDVEKAHHYLWRFWNKFPKAGHMTIFDRTWYGRVLVERIEGFAKEREWKRAYSEINEMEKQLTESGAVLLKFWMHIDKDEQAARFQARQEIPEKQWKITDEDWRNREKWDAYEEAVDEMIVRTSTNDAPWHVIEANSKLYARIKVMEIVVDALEKKLRKIKKSY